MTLVDSSVWIDYFNGFTTPQSDRLFHLLSAERLAVGDLILAEVLQGFRTERDFRDALRLMLLLDIVNVVDAEVATEAAKNYRSLRAKGVTVRKRIDTLIATRCIRDGFSLLYSDRDFDPFVEHLGLVNALSEV